MDLILNGTIYNYALCVFVPLDYNSAVQAATPGRTVNVVQETHMRLHRSLKSQSV